MNPRDALRRFFAPSPRRLVGILFAAVFVLLGAAVLRPFGPREGEWRVVRGSLEESVPFAGTLLPESSDVYGVEVPGLEMKLVFLAEEGSLVAPGDVVLRFDDAPFRREEAAARARVTELTEESAQARFALDAGKAGSATEADEATRSAETAERERDALLAVRRDLALEESRNDLDEKERDAREAKERLESLAPFLAKGYVSRDEFRTAEARRDRAEAELGLARRRHEALVVRTLPDLVKEKTGEADARRRRVSSSAQKAAAQAGQQEAGYRLALARLAEARRQLDEATRRAASCEVKAKSSGLVVYGEVFDKTGVKRKVRVGDGVFSGTPVLLLPDLSRFLVEASVPETELFRLAPGQAAELRLDAFPDRVLEGTVRSVGSLSGDASAATRRFPLRIGVKEADPRFRPGMSVRGSVKGTRVADAVLLPIEAVRRDAKGAHCFVARRFLAPERRELVLGHGNAQSVEVTSGLREGERVLLGEPDAR